MMGSLPMSPSHMPTSYASFADQYTRHLRETSFEPSCGAGAAVFAYEPKNDPHLREYHLRKRTAQNVKASRHRAGREEPGHEERESLAELWRKIRARAMQDPCVPRPCDTLSKDLRSVTPDVDARLVTPTTFAEQQRPGTPTASAGPLATPYHYLLYVTSQLGVRMRYGKQEETKPPEHTGTPVRCCQPRPPRRAPGRSFLREHAELIAADFRRRALSSKKKKRSRGSRVIAAAAQPKRDPSKKGRSQRAAFQPSPPPGVGRIACPPDAVLDTENRPAQVGRQMRHRQVLETQGRPYPQPSEAVWA